MPITTAISSQSYRDVQLLSRSKKKQDRTKTCLKRYLQKMMWKHTEQLNYVLDLHGTDEVQTFLQFAFQSTKFVLRWVDNAR